MKHFVTAIAVLLVAVPAFAGGVSVKANADGSYAVSGSMADIGTLTGASLKTASNVGKAFAAGVDTSVDFSEGHVVKGPVTASIARDNGTVGMYRIRGPVIAYDQQDTFRNGSANASLNGAILFENAKGKMVMDRGAISLIK